MVIWYVDFRMVESLTKIVQGKHVVDATNVTAQEIKLKKLGLECMVTIIRSLVDWSKELRKDFEKSGLTKQHSFMFF